MRSGRVGLVALGVVVAVGVLARWQGIAARPIWHDEVYTRIFAAGHHSHDWIEALYIGRPLSRDAVLHFQQLDPARGALDTMRGLARDEPQHPPAYYVLARVWLGVFGDGLAPLRALSVVLGVIALLAAAWLARELYGARGPPAAPALTLALVAASPFLVVYAQEAREYTLWSVWVLAASAALLRALRLAGSEPRRARRFRAWALYAVLTAAGLYTAFSHAAVILAHVVYVAWRERLRLTRTAVAAALALVGSAALFAPWAVLLVEHLEAFQASMDWARVIVVPTSEVLATLATNLSRPLVDLGPEPPGALGVAVIALAVVLVAAALVHFARRGPPARALVVLLFVVPLGLLVVPDLLFGGIRSFSARYLLPALLAALIAVAHRVASIERPVLRVGLATIVVGAALGTSLRTDPVPWSRALSAGLPAVAAAIDAAPRPLVIGDRERHHPGNLLALATLVGPDTQFMLLDHPERGRLVARAEADAQAHPGAWPPAGLPADRSLFLYAPIPQVRAALEAAAGRPATLVWRDQHVECWRLEPRTGP